MAQITSTPKQKSPTKSPESQVRGKTKVDLGRAVDAAPEAENLRQGRFTSSQVLYLQRSVGNRAVAQMLGRNEPRTQAAPLIQAKLTVGPANDRYEQEADDIAMRVLRTPATPKNQKGGKGQEEPEEVQRIPAIQRIQRRAPVGLEGGPLDGDLERSIQSAQNGGSSLPSTVRGSLEPKLNADLSGVKVHTDSKSVQLNRDLGAKAFTHKNHIFYGAGQSPSDMKLTTHEAVHSIQQGAVKQQSKVQTKRKPGQKEGE
jgi:hypothetical protein